MEISYYWPTHVDRQITSGFLNAAVGIELLDGWITVAGGVTLSVASGHILQWDENFQDQRLGTTAFGAGPMLLVRVETPALGGVSLIADVLGSLLIYSGDFPPGGDIYNFSWRLGGALAFRVHESISLTVGVRWMHVSNGQGLGPQNPSYEGLGFPLGVAYRL